MKTLVVAALVAVLVFTADGSALAVNHSGQPRQGGWAVAPANVPGKGIVPGAGTFTYLDWSLGLGTNSGSNSPHAGYTTTTVKCAVCHSVHYAGPGGAPIGAGQTADTLLRMRADQACEYCHSIAGESVNGTPVYDGHDPPSFGGGATNEGHLTGTDCDLCHAYVHVVDEDNSVASLAGFILKNQPQSAVGPRAVSTTDMLDVIKVIDDDAVGQGFAPGDALGATVDDYAMTNSVTLREQAVGIFCAECHEGAYATVAPGAATNVAGSAAVLYSGHRIAAGATTDWNTHGTKSSSGYSGQVAWAAAENCKS